MSKYLICGAGGFIGGHTAQRLLNSGPRLLKKLLMGPKYAHLNNAQIGSHINFFRSTNIYEQDVYASMCYFHI